MAKRLAKSKTVKNASKDDELNFSIKTSEKGKFVVSISERGDKHFLDFRHWFKNADDEWLPTKKGAGIDLSLVKNKRLLVKLKKLITAAEEQLGIGDED